MLKCTKFALRWDSVRDPVGAPPQTLLGELKVLLQIP